MCLPVTCRTPPKGSPTIAVRILGAQSGAVRRTVLTESVKLQVTSGRGVTGRLEPPATLLALQPLPGLRPGRALLGSPLLLPLDPPPRHECGRMALGAAVCAQPARRHHVVLGLAQ